MSFLAIFLCTANATQFIPLSIEKQVDEADFAVEATLQAHTVYRNSASAIMTDYSFIINESFGLTEKELHLDLPGGTLDGVTSMVDGAPNFEEGKKVFLLLKKVESKIYLSNFTLGEYKIVEIDGKTFYQSTVFSNDPKNGIISKEKMKSLMQEKWHYSASAPQINRTLPDQKVAVPSKALPKIARVPAEIQTPAKNTIYNSFIWGGILAIVLSAWFVLRRNK
jgi:hypothetical protein